MKAATLRYSEKTARPITMGRNGMVSTGHPLATQAALHTLRNGGNAVDAAATAAWVLAVIKPEASGVGGDFFALHYDAGSGALESLNASGRSPATSSLDAFGGELPVIGPRSINVPGAVRGWADILRRKGTLDLATVMAPAIDYAQNGFPVSVRLAAVMRLKAEALAACPAAAAAYLDGGEAYAPGQVLKLPDLARSLKAIAAGGADVMYEGEISAAIEKAQRDDGGLLTRDDLLTQKTSFAAPLSVDYRGRKVCVQHPVSMGMLLLQQLKMAEQFDLGALEWDSAERIHLLAEIKKLSFGDLNAYLSDPDFTSIPVQELLSSAYARRRCAGIDAEKAAASYTAGNLGAGSGNTTYLAVVDGSGNAVSWIQTLFGFFGSCWMAPGTGILLNNRLSGFSVDPGHVNRLEGGKRTAHTLLAPIVLENDRPVLVLGTPGDYGQTQSNLQMVTNFIDYGMDVQTMIESPRWRSIEGRTLAVEQDYRAETLDGLRRRGHELDIRGSWDSLMGGAQAIRINGQNGCLEGGADPRREGYALGW